MQMPVAVELLKYQYPKELDAEASSGGLVHYKGAGVIKNLSTSSGGSIIEKDSINLKLLAIRLLFNNEN
jgi:hypothetical protein